MNRLYRLRVLLTLAHSCILHPELRVGQILANAVEGHSAKNVRNDLPYVKDELILHALTEYNKEVL